MNQWSLPLVGAAYLLGAVPFGYVIVKLARGVDIRTVGSGNIGATNAARILGRKGAVVVFALDVLKGFLPALVGLHLGGQPLAAAAGLAAIAGHNWPLYLAFRGGKGVATSCGVFLAIFPLGLLVALGIWVGAVALWRYVSLGSILAAGSLAAMAFVLQTEPLGRGMVVTALSVLAAALTTIRHKSNIRRLLQGTENKVGQKR